ncbi:tellurite resistance/C4-dicarboxylate transporter family protein [Knoellia sp. Soil729]|uniref:tellurite resistance/C4-dicarboxylate transporter family protein n=1 Tax=Knoellia sp. Soil729 TaxID=1736394 RepID=UPI0006F9DF51|nr:tellurite resistance/C4-dicarboxylate transporter family protein [Knoellia sp. Soil729]KRE42202.1 tellurite resistance protein permease [Knoellia sp. Soil729]
MTTSPQVRARAGLLAGLTPGYYAFVMASGIVSLGFDLLGFRTLSVALFAICVVGYVVLCALNAARFTSHRRAMADDFRDPKRAFGFFTFVAGTNVLGVRAGAEGWYAVTATLLVVAGLAWLVLGYVIPWSAVLGQEERPVVAFANGTWFIWVVASQSVAVSAATLANVYPRGLHALVILAILCWSVGVFLYAASGIIVALRLMLYPLDPRDFDPPYWVAMGAVAITVVAGARIVEMDSAPMVDATRGLIAGLSVVFWAFATWLIPVLVAVGVWRHVLRKVPLRYEPTLWSMVFPLGMYAVAGIYLGRADELPIVDWIGSAWLWVAAAAWAAVFVAMLREVVRTVSGPR